MEDSILGKFAFQRMPFGLNNAPATFQRSLVAHNYIDDVQGAHWVPWLNSHPRYLKPV